MSAWDVPGESCTVMNCVGRQPGLTWSYCCPPARLHHLQTAQSEVRTGRVVLLLLLGLLGLPRPSLLLLLLRRVRRPLTVQHALPAVQPQAGCGVEGI